jgi:ribosomal protein S18 acetylase RimI-like enzyme
VACAIELLSPSRLDAAIELLERVFPWPDCVPGDALRAIFEPHLFPADLLQRSIFARVCWVAIFENRLAGTIGLYRKLDDYREALHLGWFCVEPAFRRQGIGRMLLSHAVAQAEQAGADFLRLDTSDWQDERYAQPLYEEFGFTIIRTKADHYHGVEWTEIWREKVL